MTSQVLSPVAVLYPESSGFLVSGRSPVETGLYSLETQEYTFEVVGRFVHCDGIYRTSSEVQCEIVSCPQLILNVQ